MLDDWSVTVFTERRVHGDTGIRVYGNVYLLSGQGEGFVLWGMDKVVDLLCGGFVSVCD